MNTLRLPALLSCAGFLTIALPGCDKPEGSGNPSDDVSGKADYPGDDDDDDDSDSDSDDDDDDSMTACGSACEGCVDPPFVQARAVATTRVDAFWKPVPETRDHRIFLLGDEDELDCDDELEFRDISVPGFVPTGSFRNMGLQPGEDHCYAVASVTEAGIGTASNVTCVETELADLPAPQNVAAAPDAPGTIKVTWDLVEDAVAYTVFVSSDEGVDPATTFLAIHLSPPPPGATLGLFRDRNLDEGEQLFYRVVAVDDENRGSPPSAEVTASAP